MENLEAGVQFGDFQIIKRLGSGGMGIVYLAKQVSLNRLVALKVLGAALTDPSDIARFRREAQAVARLDHPGIASVYFVGQDGQVCYIAMEFIDGASIREVVKWLASSNRSGVTMDTVLGADQKEAPQVRFDEDTAAYPPDRVADGSQVAPGSLTPQARRLMASPDYIRRCCEVVRDVALALAHAHERGVVHRDIKPGNVLLSRKGAVHLIDFGLARFFEDVSLTDTGALVGTPMYMSPEQVTGRLQIDHRTDIYSLGMVLYELLTFVRPISAPTQEGVLRQVVTKSLPPVSGRNRAIPRGLECVVHQAAAKDPDERYQSAEEFARDLSAVLDNRQVSARPYRHRLDTSEIEAERPLSVVFVSALFFVPCILLAMASLMFLLMILQTAVLAPIPKGVSKFTILQSYLLTTIYSTVLLCLSMFHLWVGWGLILGKKPYRFFAFMAYASYLILASAMLIVNSLTTDYDLRKPATMGNVLIPFNIFFFLLIINIFILFSLFKRRSREWFSMASRLRAEHKRGSNGEV